MNDDERRQAGERASALRAEAGRLRDLAMRTPNPLKAVWLTMAARRHEAMAQELGPATTLH